MASSTIPPPPPINNPDPKGPGLFIGRDIGILILKCLGFTKVQESTLAQPQVALRARAMDGPSEFPPPVYEAHVPGYRIHL